MTSPSKPSAAAVRMAGGSQSGSFLIALFAVILPLFLLVGASSATMTKRDRGLVHVIELEKAMMAADAGLDEAIWRATNGTLVSGTSFSRTVSIGQSFTVEALLLNTDGLDNDGDFLIDEADENVFRLTITATYGTATRKIAAYLGPTAVAVPPLEAGLTVTSPVPELRIEGASTIDGRDTTMAGGPGLGPNIPGLAISPPGTILDLDSELDASEDPRILGTGLPPSLAVGSGAIDFAALQLAIQNIASMVLTSDGYSNVSWGDGPSNDFRVVYREGDLRVEGVSSGAGILLVTGDLRVEDDFRWDGLIIVLGDEIRMRGTSNVTGGILCACNDRIRMEDTSTIRYSTETLSLVNTLITGTDYVAFNGWQEITVN